MSIKTTTKTPVHTGTNAPNIGEDGLSTRARKRLNKENKAKEARKKADLASSRDESGPRFSHTHGRVAVHGGDSIAQPRMKGNRTFDRRLTGKPISGDAWAWSCPAVDELRKSALDLINGKVEQEYRSFLYFYPGMDAHTWETPMSSLLNQPLRQVWPIVGFTPVKPTILGYVPPFRPSGFKQLHRNKVDEAVKQTGMSREDVKSFISRGMSSVAIAKVAAYKRSIS